MGCHFLLQCMKVKSGSEVASVVSDSVQPHRRQPTRLPRPWDSPGKNTGAGCHFLLRGISLAQGLNLCLQHWQAFFIAEPPGMPFKKFTGSEFDQDQDLGLSIHAPPLHMPKIWGITVNSNSLFWSLSKNTGARSLSLLQRIFPTQKLNRGLLHCR